MASELGNQSVQSLQSFDFSSVRGNAIQAYPVETRDVVGKRPIKSNKGNDTDQLMGYLD